MRRPPPSGGGGRGSRGEPREAHGDSGQPGTPPRQTDGPETPRRTPTATPQTPARADPAGTDARVTRAARRREVHRQPRPTHAGPTGRPSPAPAKGPEKEGERGGEAVGGTGAWARRAAPGIPTVCT